MGRLSRPPDRLRAPAARLKAPPKAALPFYHSPEWRALVKRLRAERGNHCSVCGRGGLILGDHKVELRDGGAELDPDNIQLMCLPCHQRKTAAVKAARSGKSLKNR